MTSLKIETILDITGLKKVRFTCSWQSSHLFGPKAETEKQSPVGKMPPKERTDCYKIRCLECNVLMDFDHRKKRNLKCHQDLLKKRKATRYNVISSPRNPLEATPGKSSNLSKTVTSSKSSNPDSLIIDEQKIFEFKAN